MLLAPNKIRTIDTNANKEWSQQQKQLNSSSKVIRNYSVRRFMSMTYTGGKVWLSNNEKFLACSSEQTVNIIDIDNGDILGELKGDEYVICTAVSPDDKKLFMSCRSSNLIIWSISRQKELKTIKNQHPILAMGLDPTGALLATGHSDGSVRVYDAENHYFTHYFSTNLHVGKIEFVKFHPTPGAFFVFSSALDGLKIWDLNTRQCIAHVTQHSSVISDCLVLDDVLITAGRDNILNVFSISLQEDKKKLNFLKHLKTISVFENVEGIQLLPKDSTLNLSKKSKLPILIAGETGQLKIFDGVSGDCIYKQTKDTVASPFTQLIYCKERKQYLCITEDSNFLFYDQNTLKREKQIVGFNDEILDLKLIGKQDRIAVSTNSNNILLFDLKTKNTEFLHGHSDIVLSSTTTKNEKVLISVSKDSTVRVWDLERNCCIAFGASHTQCITSVNLAPSSNSFFVSCSEDRTIKRWKMDQVWDIFEKKIEATDEKDLLPIVAEKTVIGHTKDISDIVISPDEKLIATASADKTAKIWDSDLNLQLTLQHPKGVWCCAFSNVDKCIATGCGDGIIRIWSLKTGTLLKTLEGHENPVLKLSFINVGMQIISTDFQGIVKLWLIKTNECLATFDHHSERCWGLAVKNDGRTLITGAEDSKINIWTDNTEDLAKAEKEDLDYQILGNQKLKNLMHQRKFREAVVLAISLDRPRDTYNLLQQIIQESEEELGPVIRQLTYEEITILLQYIVDWNTNSRFSSLAQHLLQCMFQNLEPNFISWSYEKSVDGLLSYSKRHFNRIQNSIQSSYMLDYLLFTMQQNRPTNSDFTKEELLKVVDQSTNKPTERAEVVDPENVTKNNIKVDVQELSEQKEEVAVVPASKVDMVEQNGNTNGTTSKEDHENEAKTPSKKRKSITTPASANKTTTPSKKLKK